MTLGGRRVAVKRPRARSADGSEEIALATYARLLRMPDRRTIAGKRDLTLLHLLGTAGLRRAEACDLVIGDVDERQRDGDPRLRRASAHSTPWWVRVTYGKRGNSRHVPLEHDALLGTDVATITGRVIDAEAGFRRWQV